MGACYQPANRLAMLWFAREKRQPPLNVWLVSLHFLGERYPTVEPGEPQVGPNSEDAWEPIVAELAPRSDGSSAGSASAVGLVDPLVRASA